VEEEDEGIHQNNCSSSSVDSGTTAASETQYLRFFKKIFCE